MQRQQEISARRLKRRIGTRQPVIIDELHNSDSSQAAAGAMILAKGRSRADAPEIDGSVFVSSRRPLRVGEIATVKIERAEAYDLHGTVVGY